MSYRSARLVLLETSGYAHALVRAFALMVAVLFMCGVLFRLFEAPTNERVRGLGSGLHWVWRTLFEQSTPWPITTVAGEAVYVVVLIAGVGLVATGTGAVASKLIDIFLRRAAGMGETRLEDHILICGWSSKGEEIIRELHAEEVRHKPPIVVLAKLDRSPVSDRRTVFIHGDPSHGDDLRRAGLEHARTAIVLADESEGIRSPEDVDAKSLLITLAIESIRSDVYTCVEVIRVEDAEHFRNAKADELIVSAEVTGALLAGAAMGHGIGSVVRDLLTHDHGRTNGHVTNELYQVAVPSRLVGLDFASAMAVLKNEEGCILIAHKRDGGEFALNPPCDLRLAADDALLVISEDEPAWAVVPAG